MVLIPILLLYVLIKAEMLMLIYTDYMNWICDNIFPAIDMLWKKKTNI
jgi:hypothetical protein